jgi:hypothetical protein
VADAEQAARPGWRQGTKVPHHVYRQRGPEPDTRAWPDGDEPVATFLDPIDAAFAVSAVNDELHREGAEQAGGELDDDLEPSDPGLPDIPPDVTRRWLRERDEARAEVRRLRAEQAARPAGDEPRPLTILTACVDQCERIVDMYAHLRLDTAEDQQLHERATTTARTAIAQARDLVERVRAAAAHVGQRDGGAALIAAERQRQVSAEGWTPEHDAGHVGDDLAVAACCYALPNTMRRWKTVRQGPGRDGRSELRSYSVPTLWPWEGRAWKPSVDDRVRELVKAGALIAAEIDRLNGTERHGGAAGDDTAPCRCGHPRYMHLNGGDWCKGGGWHDRNAPACGCQGFAAAAPLPHGHFPNPKPGTYEANTGARGFTAAAPRAGADTAPVSRDAKADAIQTAEAWRMRGAQSIISGDRNVTELETELARARARIRELGADLSLAKDALRKHEATRTLGGPVTGSRVPDDAWKNAPSAGPVQHDYSGSIDETGGQP